MYAPISYFFVGIGEKFSCFCVAGICPRHWGGEDDVLHAAAAVRGDSGVPRALGRVCGLHGFHGRRETRQTLSILLRLLL